MEGHWVWGDMDKNYLDSFQFSIIVLMWWYQLPYGYYNHYHWKHDMPIFAVIIFLFSKIKLLVFLLESNQSNNCTYLLLEISVGHIMYAIDTELNAQ